MSWYDIPKVKVQFVSNEDRTPAGVLLSAVDFEKLVEKMEDFLDHAAVERVKKAPVKFYTHEEIGTLIARKKR